jgi:hypothetical protein
MISESWAIHKFKWPLIVVCVYALRYLLAWQPNPQENRPIIINPPHTHCCVSNVVVAGTVETN